MLALQAQGEVPRDAWLWLATGARLVAKDPRTTRETTFLGPAHARACVDGREESWIAYGSLESVAGAGEAPGAEEWLVTPLAVVRYGAARLRVDVGGSNTSVAMASGVAFLSIAGDARAKRQRGDAAASAAEDGSWPEADPGWQRVDEGVVTVVPAVARPPVDAARSVVDACYSVAGRARDLAGALLSGADASPDSTVLAASEQVSTRRRARAACAMAGLRVRLLAASNARSSLLGKINEAEEAWRALPIVSPTP
jgi:hypothetical protein